MNLQICKCWTVNIFHAICVCCKFLPYFFSCFFLFLFWGMSFSKRCSASLRAFVPCSPIPIGGVRPPRHSPCVVTCAKCTPRGSLKKKKSLNIHVWGSISCKDKGTVSPALHLGAKHCKRWGRISVWRGRPGLCHTLEIYWKKKCVLLCFCLSKACLKAHFSAHGSLARQGSEKRKSKG